MRETHTLGGPLPATEGDSNFAALRRALAGIEDQVAGIHDQLVIARQREQTARAALARLVEAAAGDLDGLVAAAERTLEQLYSD